MKGVIGRQRGSLEIISRMVREAPLAVLRQMLPDRDILEACGKLGYGFRRRLYGPVVTVFHFLLKAIQREESFAATWQGLWTNAVCEFGASQSAFNSSALSQARSRLPGEILQWLARRACDVPRKKPFTWRGFHLVALDVTTLSMPREQELFDHFGAHRARTTTVRYPLATFCSLLSVESALILAYRFGPFDPGELKTARPLLEHLQPGDLLLADRSFAGTPTLVDIYSQGADFLMRKNARLRVDGLPVIRRLGSNDFLTEIPVCKPTRKRYPHLPEKVPARVFQARWITPAGETVTEWFVTSLSDPRRFRPVALARLYHARWRSETSYLEFKVFFHADVLRNKTVENVCKELHAHVLAYQLVRRLVLEAARKHRKKPTRISVLHAARWVASFSCRMSTAPAWQLPRLYQRLLNAIASTDIDVRPGRLEPRAVTREWKHYPHLRISRSQWRKKRLAETA